MSASGPLEGITVLEAGLLVQGPQAAALLAQLGCAVTKVELPGFGDQARWIPASATEARPPYFLACNRGKRSVALDLRVPAGRDAFARLAERADVVITNFAPGTMEGWGLGYEQLADRNPGLVWAAGSTFGPLGDDAEREGADLSGQAAGGLISATGVDGGEPTPLAVTIADHAAAQNLTIGVLAALLARVRSGRGQRVEVSLLGSQIWAQASEYTALFLTGAPPGRPNRGHPLINGIYGIVPTADGWLALVGVVGRLRARFFAAIGRSELSDDPRFPPGPMTEERKRALFTELGPTFATRSTAEWCEVLAAAGQRFAPVRSYDQVAEDPQMWTNGYFTTVDGQTVVGTPIALSETPAHVGAAAPELGAHTEEVLLEAGYDWDDIVALRTTGAI